MLIRLDGTWHPCAFDVEGLAPTVS
jgi:hypothetical protein